MTPALSASPPSPSRGLRVIVCAFAFVLCFVHLFLLLTVLNKFEQIFADMLGGRPLPFLTAFLFGWKPLFVIVAIALPLIAVLAVCLLRSRRQALALVGAAFFLALFQMGFPVVALFVPLSGTISAMQHTG